MTDESDPKPTQVFQCRAATRNDGTDILAVLEEVAPEIPVNLDTTNRQEMIQGIITGCCSSGESWVAVDAAGTVVGFTLAKPDVLERFHYKNNALTLPYIGVSKAWQNNGIFAALMAEFMSKGVPLTASVLNTNQSRMAERLVEIGFVKTGTKGAEEKFRWAPAPVGG